MYIQKIFDLLSNLNSSINTKENTLSFSSPMSKVLNIVSIDLAAYPQKTYVDGSLNTINSTLSNKQKYNDTPAAPAVPHWGFLSGARGARKSCDFRAARTTGVQKLYASCYRRGSLISSVAGSTPPLYNSRVFN
jgi:hypothetical protein